MSGEPGRGAAALSAAVAGVWARYSGAVLARVDVLDGAALALLEGRLGREERRAAEREAHKLAGSVGTFGFAEASRLASEAEALLGGPEPAQADALRLADLAVAIRRELTATAAEPAPAPSPGTPTWDGVAGGGPLLLVAAGDPETRERWTMEAAGRGMRTLAPATPEEARAALAGEPPDAVLLDLGFGASAGMELLRAVSEAAAETAVVVVSPRDAFPDRVEVARLGGRAFLRHPLSPARALDAVEQALRPADRASATVLAVDDDPAVLEAVRRVVARPGVRVETVADPAAFWSALEAASPEVVLLDVDMPGISGVELCRVLRGDPRWRSVPVLFLTGRTDPETVRALFEAGADDYVPKPFVGPELAARIDNRLERMRLQRVHAETDALTGVLNRGASHEVLERFLRLAAAEKEPLAFAVVELDCYRAVNERCGHAAGDAVLAHVARLLQKRFPAQDVVARWGGDEFVVGMYGMDRADGVQRLAEALEVLRAEPVAIPGHMPVQATFSAGVAEFPADGGDPAALYRAAAGALQAAREHGRDRVLPAGWTAGSGPGARTVDVLVVEDDPAIASLLQHALDTRGLRHEWIGSGARAAALLGGSAPELRARVVLLDVDLPGLDGLGVLRVLAGEGVLDRTRVIMLTVRTHETEVVQALELGAFDHVAKPFSVPVLLQRIRLALKG